MVGFLLPLTLLACGAQPKASVPTAEPSTLDPATQHIVDEELTRAVHEWHAVSAVAVVLDVATGAILAMDGRSGETRAPLLAMHRSILTGSTFKAFTLAAALDADTIAADATVDCAPRMYGAMKLSDSRPNGVLTLTDMFAASSNVGAARVFDTVGLERFTAMLRRFHLGDAPAKLPVVTDGGSYEAAMFASGELASVPPLQVLGGYATLFRGGVYLAPTLTRKPLAPEHVVRPETAQVLLTMLENTVSSDAGTGKLARVPGHRIAGKTGTADLGANHTYASFVGAAVDRSPRVAILVGMEFRGAGSTGYSGASAAAPTFARIAQRLLARVP